MKTSIWICHKCRGLATREENIYTCGDCGAQWDTDWNDVNTGVRTYVVSMCRISYGHRDIEVEAKSEEHAKELAHDIEGNFTYNETSAEYEIHDVVVKGDTIRNQLRLVSNMLDQAVNSEEA